MRAWAEALGTASDSERRAMGKAILMLLGEIETLKESLALSQPTAPAAPELDFTMPDDLPRRSPEPKDDDTATLNLRDRLRAVTHRDRD